MNAQVRDGRVVKHQLSCPKKRGIRHKEKWEEEGVEKQRRTLRWVVFVC